MHNCSLGVNSSGLPNAPDSPNISVEDVDSQDTGAALDQEATLDLGVSPHSSVSPRRSNSDQAPPTGPDGNRALVDSAPPAGSVVPPLGSSAEPRSSRAEGEASSSGLAAGRDTAFSPVQSPSPANAAVPPPTDRPRT